MPTMHVLARIFILLTERLIRDRTPTETKGTYSEKDSYLHDVPVGTSTVTRHGAVHGATSTQTPHKYVG